MHFVVPHKTTQVGAVTKVRRALQQSRSELAKHAEITEERWQGNTLHFAANVQGKSITGTVDVTAKDFVIDAKLPLLWRLFEGRIEKMIAEQMKSLQ